MADQKITDLTEVSQPELEDLLQLVEDPSGTPTSRKVTLARLLGTLFASRSEGRLTTESGVAISTADRTAQSTIYFTPYNGNRVSLYDGTRWKQYAFTERSLALSGLTTDKNYDVFLYDNAGTLTLELSAAWTTDTARADALATQDGIAVKSGATTRRHLGTIRTTGTTTTEDSAAKRFVSNRYNRVPRHMANATETANSWNYTTDTYRQANANAANQLDYVDCLADSLVEAHVYARGGNSAQNNFQSGVGVDSTSATSATLYGISGYNSAANVALSHAVYRGYPGLGRHTLVWLEKSAAAGTTTWYGDNGGTLQSGIVGTLYG